MEFLSNNRDALGPIAEIEQLFYGGDPVSMAVLKSRYVELTTATRKLVEALNGVSGGKYAKLAAVYDRIHEEIVRNFTPEPASPTGELILPLEALTPEKFTLAGAKATNLAMIHNYLGAPVPPGFVITVQALEFFLQETGWPNPIGDHRQAFTGLPRGPGRKEQGHPGDDP
jgi:pyruvate,water dikinase